MPGPRAADAQERARPKRPAALAVRHLQGDDDRHHRVTEPRVHTVRAFLDWLLEAAPQRRLGCDARTFRRRSAWCWDLEPRIHPDGVVHHVVMADGTYVNGWCLLTAVDGNDGEVLAWQ